MPILFIDIETFGNKPEENLFTEQLVLPTASDVKTGNIKDPQKIADAINEKLYIMIAEAKAKHEEAKRKHEEEYEKEWRGNALKSLNLSIICLSYAIDDSEVKHLIGPEESILTNLQLDLIDLVGVQKIGTLEICAHFGKGFDFPIIRHRCIKYNLKHLFRVFDIGRYTERVHDTQEIFAGTDYRTHYSLSKIAAFLGIPSKTLMSGGAVHDFFLRGEIDLIAQYCNEDVEVLRGVYKRLRFGL